ncbi:hypothetical protein K2173_026687 [Erythroxylum novogranatense]|uniref:procollagen-proline 4-dioxygenase n=1 Tax=Erythroxylum novogranatense TaxID=1862640 RepID=A0AAV8U0A3_9ROSI|nr:hypothetical protein K2173_026687 [Erythroxylum novogranatense]
MASLLYILFFVALTGPVFSSFAESSRKELRNNALNSKLGRVSLTRGNRVDPSQVVQLSWRPRVFLYKGFLTDDECDHLISLSQDIKEASSGEGHESSKSLLRIDDDKLARIEDRISAWTLLPRELGNALQVMRYGLEDVNRKFDYLGNFTLISREPLMATLVLHLSNVTSGGDILFPDSEPKNSSWSECSKAGNTLKPIKGNAILFFNVHLNTSPDRSSSHLRCPVLEGEMWSATKFFYLRPIDGGKASVLVSSGSDDSDCSDEDENCPRWAAIGECQRNPVFMIGSPDYYGTCRKSCDAC